MSGVALQLEVVVIPVSDAERSRDFYTGLGWRLDADVVDARGRLVQVTPPGSGCSVQFGDHVIGAPPGSANSLYLVVSDIDAARAELTSHGVDVGPVFHCDSGFHCRFEDAGGSDRVEGRAPERATYGSFATFADPDGNTWLLQEVTTRLPGRVDGTPKFYGTASELAEALRRAAAAHGEHEKRIGHADDNWPDWYAEYMVRELAGDELPT